MKLNRLPVVAIVGRPNVGKSTLFNRIIRKQDAIVDAEPGVTRDRHYEITEWSGRQFILVDTGGYIPESSAVIDKAVREQAEIAIEEADLVVLTIDAMTPLSPAEMQIAGLIKRSGKKAILAANKCDNEKIMQSVVASPEVYKLIAGPILPVSALNSRHIGDLLDEILRQFGKSFKSHLEDIRYDRTGIRLAVIGKPNVGKSSFVNAVIGSPKHIVTEIPGTTRDAIDTDFVYKGKKFTLVDTAGLRRKTKVKENLEFYSTLRTARTIQECDIALLIIDAREGVAAQDISVLEQARQLKKGLVLAVNKWDSVAKDDKTALHYEKNIRKALSPTTYIPVLFISAKTRQRVYKVLDLALQVFEERNKTIPQEQLTAFIKKTVEAYHPPAVRGKNLNIKNMVQIKTRPPVFGVITNYPELVPANYRNYIENKLRESFGFTGVPLSLTYRKSIKKDEYEH